MLKFATHLVRLLLLVSIFGFSAGGYAATGHLQPNDVESVMRQILAYHVDEESITPQIMQRALSIYVDQFDPERVYLLQQEVDVFLNPSQNVIDEVYSEYGQSQFSYFATLHTIIQQAIQRSRIWRAEQQREAYRLVQSSTDFPVDQKWEERPFASSESELKRRIKEDQMRFISSQRERVGDVGLKGKERKAIRFYERTRRSAENRYLFYDEESGRVSEEDQQDRFLTFVLKALAKSLDAHTAFFSQREAYDMKVRLEKNFKGVGIVLEESLDGVTITRVIEDGPAAKSGKLEADDRIVAVDNIKIEDYTFDKVLDLIRGEEGTVVTLGIQRGFGPELERFNVRLTRGPVVTKQDRVDYSYEEFEGGIIGTITLHSFYEGAYGVSAVRDVRNAIRELGSKGELKGLVLDMRQNTGGFLMQAVKVAGLFITNGPVVTSKYSGGETRVFRDIDGYQYFDGPLVVLTSRISASAAEIVAQALQDYGVALVVGDEETYGKGSIQHQTVTDERSPWFFKVTVGRYYTPSGVSTQVRGVKADIVVPGPLSDEEIGESFLDFPLSADAIPPLFKDSLSDLDPNARQWYRRHYLPSLQARSTLWRQMIPDLRDKSERRLLKNVEYQKYVDSSVSMDADTSKPDPQLEEAIHIVRDMLDLERSLRPRRALSSGLN